MRANEGDAAELPPLPVKIAQRLKHFEIRFERRRPLFWLTLVFCAGICADAALRPALSAIGGVFIAATLAVGAFIFLRRGELPAWHRFAAAALLAFTTGMTLHATRARIPPASDISRMTSAAPALVTLRGRITEAAAQPGITGEDLQWTWTIAAEELGDAPHVLAVSGKVQVRVQATQPIAQIGDLVEARLRLESPPDTTLPDSFDLQEWLLSRGVRRIGETNAAQVKVLAPPPLWRADLQLRRFAAVLAARVETLLPPQDNSQAGLLTALLFGRRERLDHSDREAFAISGTAHLLAISGLQIQFLAMVLWLVLGIAGLSRRRAALIVMLLTGAYCLLAGADAPVFRATVMIALYLSALGFWRQADPLNVIAAAALVILMLSPGEIFSAGFQLSFLAVLSMVTVYPALQHAWIAWRAAAHNLPDIPDQYAIDDGGVWGFGVPATWSEKCRNLLLLTLAAWLATAPCVAWHMGRFATLSLLVNLLAVPLSSVCMLGGLAMLLCSIFTTTLAVNCGVVVAILLGLLQWLNAAVATIPFASVDLPPPAVPLLLVYIAIIMWIWIERGRSVTVPRLAVLLPACLLALCASVFFREPAPAPLLTVLDLPHGRAALLEAPNGGAALIDAGGFGQGPRLAELLRRRGIRSLSFLAITADEPDAIAGAAELLRRVPAARVLLPRASGASRARRELEEFLAAKQIAYDATKSASTLHGPGDVRWEIWDDGPPPDKPVGSESALCLRLTLPGTRVLFVNARSSAALQRLLTKIPAADCQAEFVRVCAGQNRRVPPEFAQLLGNSGCHTLIVGARDDAADYAGLDLERTAAARSLRLVTPFREGTLRIEAGTQFNRAPALHSYRNGAWQEVR